MSKKNSAVVEQFQQTFRDLNLTHQVIGLIRTHKGGHTLSVRDPHGKTQQITFPHGQKPERIAALLNTSFDGKKTRRADYRPQQGS